MKLAYPNGICEAPKANSQELRVTSDKGKVTSDEAIFYSRIKLASPKQIASTESTLSRNDGNKEIAVEYWRIK